ncbi:MAG: YCF48-related protein, partial [Candidatus Eisenbacteria bacterium]
MTFPVRGWLARLLLVGPLACVLAFAGAAEAQGFRAVFSRDGTDVWAVGDAGAVWRSFDGGSNWTATPAQGPGVLYGVAARGLNAILVGDNGRVYRSTNSGGAWAMQVLPGAPDLRGIEWPADNAAFAIGGNGAIYFSSDGGQSWAPQTSGTSAKLYGVRFRDASNGWAVGAGGVALRTSNGGALWTTLTTPTTRDLLAVDFVGSDVWVVGAFATAYKSANAGGAWTPVNLKMDSQGDVRAVTMESPNKITLTGGGGFLRTTLDGGATWTFALHPLLGAGSDYFAYDTQKAWLVSSATRAVARTTNGGTSWAFGVGTGTTWDWQNALPGPYVITRGNTFATTPQNRNAVWVVIAQYIYKSVDRGATWAFVDSIPNCIKTNSFYVSPKDSTVWVAAVGTPDRIVRTTNSGATWSPGFPRDFSEYGMPLEMNPDKPDTLLFAPEDGKLWRSKDFGVTWDSLSTPL